MRVFKKEKEILEERCQGVCGLELSILARAHSPAHLAPYKLTKFFGQIYIFQWVRAEGFVKKFSLI